jgi:hypothetical protein
VVTLWLLRALNLGPRLLWIVTWVVSIVWHVAFVCVAVLVATGAPAAGLVMLTLMLPPLVWIFGALACSIGGLISDLQRPQNLQRGV